MNAQTQIDFPAGAVAWLPPRLSIIVPTFNERDNVALLYEIARGGLRRRAVRDDRRRRQFARRHGRRRQGRCSATTPTSAACSASAGAVSPPPASRAFRRAPRRSSRVMDADHQHDETILPQMLAKAVAGDDIVVATRYAEGGSAGEGFSTTRAAGSQLGDAPVERADRRQPLRPDVGLFPDAQGSIRRGSRRRSPTTASRSCSTSSSAR